MLLAFLANMIADIPSCYTGFDSLPSVVSTAGQEVSISRTRPESKFTATFATGKHQLLA